IRSVSTPSKDADGQCSRACRRPNRRAEHRPQPRDRRPGGARAPAEYADREKGHGVHVSTAPVASEVVEAEGHLIDSRLMTEILDTVVQHGAAFEVLEFAIGRTNDEFSRLRMRVNATTAGQMQELLEELLSLGCRLSSERDAA